MRQSVIQCSGRVKIATPPIGDFRPALTPVHKDRKTECISAWSISAIYALMLIGFTQHELKATLGPLVLRVSEAQSRQ